MFDSLAEKLQATLADVRNHGILTEGDIDGAMREIRLALLEADVSSPPKSRSAVWVRR
jgi:signal recognition particle subunit SRP54